MRFWVRPGVQFASCRGSDRGSSDRNGHAGPKAGRRDSVLRLHLAGDDAIAQRAAAHSLALEQRIFGSLCDSGCHRRIPDGRRHLPLPMRREQGLKIELIDLRSLNPFDWEAIAASVRKTNRVLVAYEDSLSWGYGAEIAARISDQLFEHLDAPVRRVAALDTYVAYQPLLENAILPQTSDLYRAMKDLAEF